MLYGRRRGAARVDLGKKVAGGEKIAPGKDRIVTAIETDEKDIRRMLARADDSEGMLTRQGTHGRAAGVEKGHSTIPIGIGS
jgi:hypothetical protein